MDSFPQLWVGWIFLSLIHLDTGDRRMAALIGSYPDTAS